MSRTRRTEPRSRGVRLSDLDRARVYRIGFIGRRWEVLGAEGDPEPAGSGTDADGPAGADGGAASTVGAPHRARHAAPDASRPEGAYPAPR